MKRVRRRIDEYDDKGAEWMIDEFDLRSRRASFERAQDQERQTPAGNVCDIGHLVNVMNAAQTKKKDGLIEFGNGCLEDALTRFREADWMLKRWRAPAQDTGGNRLIAELHVSVLKNLAPVAHAVLWEPFRK